MAVEILCESSPQPLIKEGDGFKIVLITPGQGTSGYYTEELLKTQPVGTIWPKGAHSYVDHPTKDSPGRTPLKLIGVLSEDAHWSDEDNGVISHLVPLPSRRQFVEEVAAYTGLSVYVAGESRQESIGGEEVKMVTSFIPDIRNTVDLVSYAGRGGHFAESLLEEALSIDPQSEISAGNSKEGNEKMTLEEQVASLILEVRNLIAENQRLREERDAGKSEAQEADADASKAVDATIAVNEAEITESMKAELIGEIKAGHYEVEPRIEAYVKLREEILAEAKAEQEEKEPLVESFGTFVSKAPASKADAVIVQGW